MAIDFGLKRTGIAVTDNLKMIATSLKALPTKEVIPFLKVYFEKEKVETIVVGYPLNLDNSENEIEKNIQTFIVDLKNNFPDKKIERMDERFTSKLAQRTILEAGIKKSDRKNKMLADKVSATIILQNYLETIK